MDFDNVDKVILWVPLYKRYNKLSKKISTYSFMDQLIQNEKNNPELQNTLNIDEILEAAEHVDREYIEHHSLKTISEEIFDCLQETNI